MKKLMANDTQKHTFYILFLSQYLTQEEMALTLENTLIKVWTRDEQNENWTTTTTTQSTCKE